jgi:cytochrome c-type biogenesis protein CcmI
MAASLAAKWLVMIWLVFVLLTCAAILSVLLPLVLQGRGDTDRRSETRFYERSIREIDEELEAGFWSSNDAATLKLEAARRLLRTQDAPLQLRSASSLASAIAAIDQFIFAPRPL